MNFFLATVEDHENIVKRFKVQTEKFSLFSDSDILISPKIRSKQVNFTDMPPLLKIDNIESPKVESPKTISPKTNQSESFSPNETKNILINIEQNNNEVKNNENKGFVSFTRQTMITNITNPVLQSNYYSPEIKSHIRAEENLGGSFYQSNSACMWRIVKCENNPKLFKFIITNTTKIQYAAWLFANNLNYLNNRATLCRYFFQSSPPKCSIFMCNYIHDFTKMSFILRHKNYKTKSCLAAKSKKCEYNGRCFNIHENCDIRSLVNKEFSFEEFLITFFR